MCGIAAISLPENYTASRAWLLAELAVSLMPRGRDATGIAWRDTKVKEGDGWAHILKADKDAMSFMDDILRYEKDLYGVTDAIVHTRYATQGHQSNNGNNHPIARPGVVGVHNGMVSNDDEIFKMTGLPRDAKVDSEAIFALREHMKDQPTHAFLEEIEGSFALAWIEDDGVGGLHLCRGNGSPLIVATTSGGALIAASTEGAIQATLKVLKKATITEMQTIPEGTYLRVWDGKVVDRVKFKVKEMKWTYKTPNYGTGRSTLPRTTTSYMTGRDDSDSYTRWWVDRQYQLPAALRDANEAAANAAANAMKIDPLVGNTPLPPHSATTPRLGISTENPYKDKGKNNKKSRVSQ